MKTTNTKATKNKFHSSDWIAVPLLFLVILVAVYGLASWARDSEAERLIRWDRQPVCQVIEDGKQYGIDVRTGRKVEKREYVSCEEDFQYRCSMNDDCYRGYL